MGLPNSSGSIASTTQVESARPKTTLNLFDAIALIVGIVIGAGIFETPALVAANTGTNSAALLAWIAGGVVSLIGALCYAELATNYPHVGGNYYYLQRAYGNAIAFLFAWARMTIVQTGSIALLAFVFGDYASEIFSLGNFSTPIYAAGAIVLFTVINLAGLRLGKGVQNALSAAKVVGLILVVIIGLFTSPTAAPVVTESKSSLSWGLAMILVLLSYGGWNEAAYISAEIQNPRRNIVRSLLWSIGIITAIYVAINAAYLHGLGISAMANSPAVAAELMRRAFGQPGVVFISVLVAISALGAMNATIFTGARTNYALGQDFSVFRALGTWRSQQNTPTTALLVQGAISLFLIGLGVLTRKGFEAMVDYTAPVFWFFFLLVGISVFILRSQEPLQENGFRVPFYPITPILFCLICGYLLYSSLVYVKTGAIAGVVVLALGIPVLYRQNQLR
ncbi:MULTISPECIES: APC family permease [Leptolyngbya]|jgi:APA family basic amino acid/polyamine antiporter|uniref:Amino acid permease-associated region n=2 Tax=Leptolyngbya boryana TaxID=1184 RepID=A0A1Z4JD29_LEPBY|nr:MULTISPECIES: amino acid permease [Leptolyngbya]BAY54367.1 amino acid permease-associated region [Leptolyngbya boryana NIES-2135]MBD2370124.1 amino acid permease [Leptolyngbya sp. FACHB-161]MBD2376409.1 amino acid permease [Leptolyngbya sp. FACHB-238]MBD2400683.1 amino acid permease [Leptolyngbya sp. FACHB-239]MBD2407226.1 amino acid permease [Leptolyngbya sp. FACHB-402]